MPDDPAWLCSAAAVRERCTGLLAVAETSGLPHFTVHVDRLIDAADRTVATIRRTYPTLQIPHHARWRHFATGGIDRWEALAATLPADPAEQARLRVELCIVSVLLDAGAGPIWRYTEPGTGMTLGRSEGLGVASLHAFRSGLFSTASSPRIDAVALARLDRSALAAAFQVTPDNPLAGLEGRVVLLRSLSAAILTRPDIFQGRLGNIYDKVLTAGLPVQAETILAVILEGLGPVWPSRITLGGRPLGDTWRHSAAPGDHLVPFHKLSQWLAYSLIEVFEDAGHTVTGIGALTGLPEYRNGGLLIDTGVLQPRDPGLPSRPLRPEDEAIVEWRALTVALLDRLAPMIRDRLGQDEASLPLSRILEGGTWAAGRAIAAERRPGGGPPLNIITDGTVF